MTDKMYRVTGPSSSPSAIRAPQCPKMEASEPLAVHRLLLLVLVDLAPDVSP